LYPGTSLFTMTSGHMLLPIVRSSGGGDPEGGGGGAAARGLPPGTPAKDAMAGGEGGSVDSRINARGKAGSRTKPPEQKRRGEEEGEERGAAGSPHGLEHSFARGQLELPDPACQLAAIKYRRVCLKKTVSPQLPTHCLNCQTCMPVCSDQVPECLLETNCQPAATYPLHDSPPNRNHKSSHELGSMRPAVLVNTTIIQPPQP
jgi:hypothetical protein